MASPPFSSKSMDKFIIFKLKDVTTAGASVSDDGTGIEIISLPIKSISHMTASTGRVNIFYKDVSLYDESNLTTGESIQKSVVTLSCDEGAEFELIERISNFAGLKEGSKAIVFDAQVDGDILAVVRTHPVNRVTGKTSVVTDSSFTAVTSNTINDINFGHVDHKPILDLDARDVTFGGALNTLSAWTNGGTGGADYNWASTTIVGGGTGITKSAGTVESNLSTDIGFPFFLQTTYITLANQLSVAGEYTMYMVYSNGSGATESRAPIIYGNDKADLGGGGIGLPIDTSLSGDVEKNIINEIGILYADRYGHPAMAKALIPLDEVTPCVIVVRRDDDDNISMYNANGDLLAFIPRDVVDRVDGLALNDGDTSGDLKIKHIGSAQQDGSYSFRGRLARFGVIETDIGPTEAQRLAKDLYELYSIN